MLVVGSCVVAPPRRVARSGTVRIQVVNARLYVIRVLHVTDIDAWKLMPRYIVLTFIELEDYTIILKSTPGGIVVHSSKTVHVPNSGLTTPFNITWLSKYTKAFTKSPSLNEKLRNHRCRKLSKCHRRTRCFRGMNRTLFNLFAAHITPSRGRPQCQPRWCR